jgi:hypothetical protein
MRYSAHEMHRLRPSSPHGRATKVRNRWPKAPIFQLEYFDTVQGPEPLPSSPPRKAPSGPGQTKTLFPCKGQAPSLQPARHAPVLSRCCYGHGWGLLPARWVLAFMAESPLLAR